MQLLHKVFELQYEEGTEQMKVIDGTEFNNSYWPRTSKTFGDYCDDEPVKVVYSFSKGVDRMSFVFDRYLKNSIKKQISDSKGNGMPISVRRDASLIGDFMIFMRDIESKVELFLMITNSVSQVREVPTSIIATVN